MTDGIRHDRNSCIFCQICDGKQNNELKYEDDKYVAFTDYRPAATHHYLIVPRVHYKNAQILKPDEAYIITEMVDIGERLLIEKKGDKDGIRMGFHWPPFHSVSHLHLHVIAPEAEMGYISRGIFKTNSFWFVSPDTAIERITKKDS